VKRALRVIAITLLLGAQGAHADKIDDLIDQLDNSSDRVRITAVLALTNQQSPRSIDALAKTLGSRGEQKNIRGLAATALGRILQNGKPSAAQRKTAIDALTRAKSDPEPFVSAKADAALAAADSGGGSTTQVAATNGVYTSIGPMAVNAPTASGPDKTKFRAMMEKTAKDTLAKTEPKIKQTWPGGKVPTKQDLDSKGIAGFYVDGTLNTLTIATSGKVATVTCKVSMLFASFPDRNIIGTLVGGAGVEGGSSPRDIELAKSDCVQAVVEDLIAKKIVPTIRSKATP
jgi:RNase P/RNase MRP subunit p29